MSIVDDLLGGITGVTSGLWPDPAAKPHLVDGRLRPCPGTPNCVCSESAKPGEHVEPLSFKGEPGKAWALLKQCVASMGGTVRHEEGSYLWTTFVVPVFGFTDDVEFRIDEAAGVIHVRSASRLGFSDLGVNRSRIDQLRSEFGRRC
ncbi:MAG: DUF1499 domain-containing protein [Chlorobiaceae bacterium]|nr:DUF1499 domain-containing protein [Chlorobiaceae bacterium]